MKKKIVISFLFLFCCFISSPCFSSPVLSFSDDVFINSSGSVYYSFGRTLLANPPPAKKPCPVNFGTKDYTNLTSQCKPPDYPAEKCCRAFKTFSCPYYAELNDPSANCSSEMFSYLHNYYPSGLLVSKCKQCNLGLDCEGYVPAAKTSVNNTVSSNSHNIRGPSMLLVLTTGFIIF